MNDLPHTRQAPDTPRTGDGASACAATTSTDARLDRLFRRSLPPQPAHPLRALIDAYREAGTRGDSHG